MVQKLAPVSRRAYSSEMANALVQVSQNIGMGNAAIGLGGVSTFPVQIWDVLEIHISNLNPIDIPPLYTITLC